jgi:hypothetical protein
LPKTPLEKGVCIFVGTDQHSVKLTFLITAWSRTLKSVVFHGDAMENHKKISVRTDKALKWIQSEHIHETSFLLP